MTDPASRFERLRRHVDERNLRERILLLAAIVVVLVLAWDLAIRAPFATRGEAAADRISQLERDSEGLRQTERSLRAELEALEDDRRTDRLSRLQAELAAADAALAQRTARVVSPSQMVSVLRDMVSADDALTLESLANRGVEAVITEDHDDGIPRVYRHRVEVVASGDFFALLGYLQRLEDLEWQFQWDDLSLETIRYPRARVTILLSTLSLDEGWIGV